LDIYCQRIFGDGAFLCELRRVNYDDFRDDRQYSSDANGSAELRFSQWKFRTCLRNDSFGAGAYQRQCYRRYRGVAGACTAIEYAADADRPIFGGFEYLFADESWIELCASGGKLPADSVDLGAERWKWRSDAGLKRLRQSGMELRGAT
jgi:hypothetical protein